MAYKKYIKRGGKVYGPYIYHSKRVDGKVVSEYRGPEKLSIKKVSLAIFGFLLLAGIIFFAFSGKIPTPTGFVSLNLDSNSQEETTSSGMLNLSLEEGDFVPASSKLVFENKGNRYEYNLEDFVSDKGSVKKVVYPFVYFNSTVRLEEMSTNETINLSVNSFVSTGENYTYNLSGNLNSNPGKKYFVKDVKIHKEDIRTSSKSLSNTDDVVRADIEGDNVTFFTNYSEIIPGFAENESFEINLSDFNLSFDGLLKIYLIYSEEEIASFETVVGNQSQQETPFLPKNPGGVIFQEPEQGIASNGTKDSGTVGIPHIIQDREILELTDSERAVLLENFGQDSVEIKEAAERRGFIILKYELGDYYSEFAYDSNLSNESLSSFAKKDRVGWLKDIARSLSQIEEEEQYFNFSV